MTLTQTLDADRLRGFRIKVAVLSSFGLFLDGYDLTVIAVALPQLEKQWQIHGWLGGAVGASALVGMLVGAVAVGFLTDRIGRKTVYLLDLVAFVVFAGLTAAAQDVWQLIALRFLLGLAIGADYPISSSLTAEFSSTARRGAYIARMSTAYGFGAAAAYVLGGLLASSGADSWRWLLLVGAGLAIIVIVARGSIPESPRWLSSQGRESESRKVLDRLSRTAGMGEQTDPAPQADEDEACGQPDRRPWSDLFGSEFRRTTAFACGFYFFFAVAFYGIQIYQPSIISGLSGSSQAGADFAAAGIALLGTVGQFVGSFLLERWGRRPTVILGFAGQGALLAVVAVLAPGFLPLVTCIALAIVLINIGPGVAILLYPSELFPSALRGSGVGLTVAASRIGAVLGVLVFPVLVLAWGDARALWIFVASAAAGLTVCLFLAPETKGRVLDEETTHLAAPADAAPSVRN